MKKALALLLVLIMTVSLAACSSSSNSESSAAPSSDASEGADVSSDTSSGEEEMVIRITDELKPDGEAPNDVTRFKKGLEEAGFFEEHPNVKFEGGFVAESADFNQKMITMALSGSQEYDVVWVSAADVGVLANGGVLLNLDDYYANETRFDIQDNETWITDAANNFIYYKDSAYAFPYQTDCRIAFYYRPICEKAGYTSENYPKTTEEFVKFCQDVSAAGYNPFAIMNGADWTIVYEWALPYYGDGGTFERFDEDSQKWVANLDNDAARDWIENVRAICQTIPGDYVTTCGDEEASKLAAEGGAACHWTGTWFWERWINMDEEMTSQYDAALIPAGSQKSASSMGGGMVGINKQISKEKQDMVWEMFAALATNPEANAVATAGGMPFLRGAYEYSKWAQYDWSKKGWALFEEQLGTAQPVCTPPCEAGANIYSSMYTVWQEVTLDDTYSVDEAVTMLNDSVQSALDSFYGY